MATLQQIAVLSGHTDRVWNVCWHPTRQLLATCGGDRSIRFWCPRSTTSQGDSSDAVPQWVCIDVLDDFTTRTVRTVSWSPCGHFIAAGSFDAKAYVWRVQLSPGDLTAPGAMKILPLATLDGHENEVKSVAWSPSGSLLATSSRDKSVWIWELIEDGREIDMVAALTGHEQDVKAVAWHPSLDLLASASYDNTLRLWGEGEDDWVSICTLGGHSSTVWDCAWEPAKGSRLASVSDDGSIQLWRASPAPLGSTTVPGAVTLTSAGGLPNAHSRTVYSVAWAEDPAAASISQSTTTDGDEAQGQGLNLAVGADAPAPCRLATSGADDCIRVFVETPAGQGADAGAAHAGSEGAVALRPSVTVLKAHAGDVNCVRWQSPRLSKQWLPGSGAGGHSLVLASAGDDNLVKLWKYCE